MNEDNINHLPIGNVYIADSNNYRIRKVTISTGIITTIAGTGTAGFSGDGGDAVSATFSYIYGVTIDSSGIQNIITYQHVYLPYIVFYISLANVYITDLTTNRIRKITSSTGIIMTIAGSGTSAGFSGDGGDATSALLCAPYSVAVGSSGNEYNTNLLVIICYLYFSTR